MNIINSNMDIIDKKQFLFCAIQKTQMMISATIFLDKYGALSNNADTW
jgi:hypothetical protein